MLKTSKMSLYESFLGVKDVRKLSGKRHGLSSFLTMTTLGIMSGYTSLQSLATFFKSNEEEFTDLFDLKHGVPSYTQTRTILAEMDYTSLYENFELWALQYICIEAGDWVSGDGKGLNSTVTNAQDAKQNYVAMVSLFLQRLGVVVGVNRYENGKEGEGSKLRELVSILKNKGVIITLDALHCQKKQ